MRLSAGAPVSGGVPIPGGRVTVIALAMVGLATTAFSIVLAFLLPPDEPNPALAIFKVPGVTVALLLAGAMVYAIGGARSRRAVPG